MTQRQRTTIPELERLRALINDRDMTAAEVDRLEEELTDARAQVRTARDLAEADTLVARVANLESELARAEQRAAMAADILRRDGAALQEAALRQTRADLVKRFGPEAARLDKAVIATTTALFELFAERRRLESEAGSTILEIPSVGMGNINPQNCGIMTRSTAIGHYTLQLQGIERHFAPVE